MLKNYRVNKQLLQYIKLKLEAIGIDDNVFYSQYIVGSKGWGIEESIDTNSDLDLLVILETEKFHYFQSVHGKELLLDDEFEGLKIFGQIRDVSWLKDRLFSEITDTRIVYHWIMINSITIQDNLSIVKLIEQSAESFDSNLQESISEFIIRFNVRSYDFKASIKRHLESSSLIYKGHYIEAALKLFSLLNGYPYPYIKWLNKNVEFIESENSSKLLILIKDSLLNQDPDENIIIAKGITKLLRLEVIQKSPLLISQFDEWWKFNKN